MENNELISRMHKKTCRYFSYDEHLLTLASTVTGCVFISAVSLVGVPVGITNSAVELKICVNNCRNQKV